MTDHERFEEIKRGAMEANEAAYGAEIRRTYGDEEMDRINDRTLSITEETFRQWQALGDEIREALSAAVLAGADPAGPEGQRVVALHRQWLGFLRTDQTAQPGGGLAELFLLNDQFTAYYDREVPGCAAFLQEAVMACLDAEEAAADGGGPEA